MVKRLCRHASGVHDRYYDSPENQAEALKNLPTLYPPQGLAGEVFRDATAAGARKSWKKGVDTETANRPNGAATPMMNSPVKSENPRPPAGRIGVASEKLAGTGLPAFSGNGSSPISRAETTNGEIGAHKEGPDFEDAGRGCRGSNGPRDRKAADGQPIAGSLGAGVETGAPCIRDHVGFDPRHPHSSDITDARHRAELAAVEALAAFLRRGGGQ